MQNIKQAADEMKYNRPLQILSRGDSTLRGHYPAETGIAYFTIIY